MDLFRYIELGAVTVLAVGLLSIVSKAMDKMLRQTAAREIAWRREVVEREERITMLLTNHFAHDQEIQQKINEHMGATVEAIRGLQIAVIAAPRTRKRK